MSFGLRVWDAAGNLRLDTSDIGFFFIGSVIISGPGSLSDNRLLLGTPIWLFYPSGYGTLIGTPSVGFSGPTMGWGPDIVSGAPYDGTLFYGLK